jgi:hypothetical protein
LGEASARLFAEALSVQRGRRSEEQTHQASQLSQCASAFQLWREQWTAVRRGGMGRIEAREEFRTDRRSGLPLWRSAVTTGEPFAFSLDFSRIAERGAMTGRMRHVDSRGQSQMSSQDRNGFPERPRFLIRSREGRSFARQDYSPRGSVTVYAGWPVLASHPRSRFLSCPPPQHASLLPTRIYVTGGFPVYARQVQ